MSRGSRTQWMICAPGQHQPDQARDSGNCPASCRRCGPCPAPAHAGRRDRSAPPRRARRRRARRCAGRRLASRRRRGRQKARPSADPLAGAVRLRWAARICSHKRGAGARHADDEHRRRIGVAGARPRAKRARSKCAMLASTKARCASRENGWLRAAAHGPASQCAKRGAWCASAPTRIWRDRNAP